MTSLVSGASAGSVSPPALGVGITYSSAIEPVLERWPDLVQVLEIEPQTTWVRTRNAHVPYRVDEDVLEHLGTLPGHKLIHSVGTPVGGTVRPEPEQLELLRATIKRFGASWASDHLSFNQTPEFATGFFLPPRQTHEGVRTVVSSTRDLQGALPVPLAVETGVNYLRPRPDELPDGEFVARVVEGADCGLLLDLHNVFTNALNGRQPVNDYLDSLPLDRIWEIHLAGGMELDGFWLDAHSGAIPDPLLSICEELIPRLPQLGAIIFEIFPSFVESVGLDVIGAQLERLQRLWTLQSRAIPTQDDRQPFRQPSDIQEPASPAAWEAALGRAVTGQSTEDALQAELANDPGTRLVEGLIHEFRGSMIVGTLRLTSRLLILALGPKVFRTLLSDYWATVPPQMYGSNEASAFATYLHSLDMEIPYLPQIVDFEQAVLATLTDDQPRIVSFDFEPLPLLRALAEGRLPDEPLVSGLFEIELTSDGPSSLDLTKLDDLKQAYPFH